MSAAAGWEAISVLLQQRQDVGENFVHHVLRSHGEALCLSHALVEALDLVRQNRTADLKLGREQNLSNG